MNIYLICPVRHCTQKEYTEIKTYVKRLERQGHRIFFPHRDAPQNSETGYEIVMAEKRAISNSDEVHIYWKIKSKGSHFDLGMAIALNKKIVLVNNPIDVVEKSYIKVMKKYIENWNEA